MCGIVGLSLSEPVAWASVAVAEMTDSLTHRGPDSSGHYACPSGSAYFGFRRLAIRDLDPRANQPMRSASRRTVIAFNGEIYNTAELSARHCSGAKLRSTGDTEVFLEAFERRGPDILPECNGMFAAAFFNTADRTITLVRDRMGKKPLFLYEGDGFLAFASELRAFRRFGLEPDPQQAPYYFHFGYLPAPHTFYQHVTQLCPGELAVIQDGRVLSRRRYHDFTDLAWGSNAELDLDQLDATIADAVALRTVSDVPAGAFLSGGVDSSLITSHLQAQGRTDLPTFTVGFEDPRYNEAPHAADIARELKLPNISIPIDTPRLYDLISEYFDCYEQPFADSSGLPTMLLCKEVKRHVTVALSGDGGDEFFGGYVRYNWYRKALRAQKWPGLARRLLGAVAPRVDGRRGLRIARLLETRDPAGLYAQLIRAWAGDSVRDLLRDVPQVEEAPVQIVRDHFARLTCDPLAKAACFDAAYYIPDDIQVKVDRASMRYALEVRCPLLDFRVARLGAEMASRTKFRGGLKSALKTLLARRVPRTLFERPKRGFAVPIERWLRGPLRDTVRDMFQAQAVRECGWLDADAVRRVREGFERGRSDLAGPVWMLFVLAMNLQRTRSQNLGSDLSHRRAA